MSILTRAGASILGLCLASYLAGWNLGWNEFMVCSSASGLALLVACPFVVGRHRLVVVRSLSTPHVMVGEPAVSTLTVSNPTRVPVGNRQVEERLDDIRQPVDITGLQPGTSLAVEHDLPTHRRGIVHVGPAVVAKADPLGLLRRAVEQTGVDSLWVHPRVVPVDPVPVGFAKDLEGPTSDTSPAGDVSFHTLRPYEIGDDHRHVHWLSTARAGTLIVRHFVDNRRPHLTVVLDVEPVYPGACFELAVSVAASVVIGTRRAGQPVTLRCGDRPVAEILEELTLVQPTSNTLEDGVRSALLHERESSALIIVTGPRPADSLLALLEVARRSTHVVVVRCCTDADGVHLPGITTFSVDDLDGFGAAWNRALR